MALKPIRKSISLFQPIRWAVSYFTRMVVQLTVYMQRAPQTILQRGSSNGRKPQPSDVETLHETPDHAQMVLADLDALDPKRRDVVAHNLGLLWDAFLEEFGGVSGFLAEQVVHQDAYLAKLDAAARRMQASKASNAGHHYVSVALMKEYVSGFRSLSITESMVELAHRVASLIDRSRELDA